MKRIILIPILLSTILLVGCGEIPENNQKSLKNKEALEALYEVSTLCTAVYELIIEDSYDLVKQAKKDKETCIANSKAAASGMGEVLCELKIEFLVPQSIVEIHEDKAIEFSDLATRVSQDLFPEKSSKFIKNKERKKVDEYKKKFKRSGINPANAASYDDLILGADYENCGNFRKEYDQYF